MGRQEPIADQTQRAKEIAKKSVGEIIREARQKNGLKQDALATVLHVTPQAISRWETGQTAPDINLLLPLAKALNLSVDQLLGGDRRQDAELRFTESIPYGLAAQLLVCEDALKEFPTDEDFLYRRACCEFFLGKDPKMSEAHRNQYLHRASYNMRQLHRRDPDNDSYTSMLAQIYVELGEREQARIILSKCKDSELIDRVLANVVLEGDEKIELQQMRVSKQITELYNRLLEYHTPESIAVAHRLLDITMGKEKRLHCSFLQMLYLSQATFALDAGDMAGYDKYMTAAYEAAEVYDREIKTAGRYTAPLFDHLDNEYVEWAFSEMESLLVQVLTDCQYLPPCDAKRRMVEHQIHCHPLNKDKASARAYCRFCIDHVNEGLTFFNFSNTWDMTKEELAQFNEQIMSSPTRYPGNGTAHLVELHRKEAERLITDGIMSGYVAGYIGHCPNVCGYCNCGAKEKYAGMPDEWKGNEPDGARVFAIMELLVAPTFRDCGLEEKLVAHALKEAREQGFTHAQAYLWDDGMLDKNGNRNFDHLLALYTAMGFAVCADLFHVHQRREYVLQKKL